MKPVYFALALVLSIGLASCGDPLSMRFGDLSPKTQQAIEPYLTLRQGEWIRQGAERHRPAAGIYNATVRSLLTEGREIWLKQPRPRPGKQPTFHELLDSPFGVLDEQKLETVVAPRMTLKDFNDLIAIIWHLQQQHKPEEIRAATLRQLLADAALNGWRYRDREQRLGGPPVMLLRE